MLAFKTEAHDGKNKQFLDDGTERTNHTRNLKPKNKGATQTKIAGRNFIHNTHLHTQPPLNEETGDRRSGDIVDSEEKKETSKEDSILSLDENVDARKMKKTLNS